MKPRYGFIVVRPEWVCRILPAEPRNALEAFWWKVKPIWEDVIVPAFWFALAFTVIKFTLFA